jgi:hypothetical protein
MNQAKLMADQKLSENKSVFSFHFVGIIVVGENMLICFPKYIRKKAKPYYEMWQILKAFEQPQIKNLLISSDDQKMDISFTKLELIKNLLENYREHGLYHHLMDSSEKNGLGEIDWEKTIAHTQPLLEGDCCYYPHVITRRKKITADYFSKLHTCILTHASQVMKELDIFELFELPEVQGYEGALSDFGERDYILIQIEKEMDRQFSMQKLNVLQLMYAYVLNYYEHEGLTIYGTSHFELVWETVLSDILNNQLECSLINLDLGEELSKKYDPQALLIDVIEKPLWTYTHKRALDTFIPDIITLKSYDENYYFMIFDAKYYVPQLVRGTSLSNQPGIEAIAKQYCYELAYADFIHDHHLSAINCFLFPTEENEVIEQGEVSMMMFEKRGLRPIRIRYLPAEWAFRLFIEGKDFDLGALHLFETGK